MSRLKRKMVYLHDEPEKGIPIQLIPIPRGQLMRSLRRDAFEALGTANPKADRRRLRNGAKILAKTWYQAIMRGEMPIKAVQEG